MLLLHWLSTRYYCSACKLEARGACRKCECSQFFVSPIIILTSLYIRVICPLQVLSTFGALQVVPFALSNNDLLVFIHTIAEGMQEQ